MASHDVEKGLDNGPSASGAGIFTSDSRNHSIRGEDEDSVPASSRDNLEVFQTLVGIRFLAKGGGPISEKDMPARPASTFQDIFRPDKASVNRFRNRGLYDRALSQELKNRVLYTGSAYIIFSLYILQILLAATITAISAYHDTASVPLTVLGALNTVVAGLLAWLTGQGMPARFRRARDQYREVVKSIEAAERMFAEAEYVSWLPGERPDPIVERNKLEGLFEQARMDQEANYPDVHYTPPDHQAAEKQQKVQEELEKWKSHSHRRDGEVEALQKELDQLKNFIKGRVASAKEEASQIDGLEHQE